MKRKCTSLKDVRIVNFIDRPGYNGIWKAMPLSGQVIDLEQWNHFAFTLPFYATPDGSRLGVYIWSNSGEEVLIDEIRVRQIRE